ncbi:hypothetical protein JXA12_05815 [Candidatus Woesearchaeota archaeon]|nr:hypothetical protein [Candidatus Woesearchaeota archaeon]
MRRKGQAEYLWGFLVLVVLAPVLISIFNAVGDAIDSSSCQEEKSQIKTLSGDISRLETALTGCRQDLIERSLDYETKLRECYDSLGDSETAVEQCSQNLTQTMKELEEARKPFYNYFFVKVYEDKTILFNNIVVYHIQAFILFFGFGVSLTLKLFEINLEINVKVLNRKEQRKIRNKIRDFLHDVEDAIREWLAQHPWGPVFIAMLLILVTNLIFWISLI